MANNEAAHNQTLTYILVTDNKVTLDRESIALDRATREDYLNQHSLLILVFQFRPWLKYDLSLAETGNPLQQKKY